MSVTYTNNNPINAGAVPVDTVIKTTSTTDGETQHVIVDSDQGILYDEILVTYTSTDKDVISKVEWKLDAVVVKTLTPTFGTTTDDWVAT